MLYLLQLFLALLAIYGALNFPEGQKLLVPLACLLMMLLITRIDKAKAQTRKDQEGKAMKKDSATMKDQNHFIVESLLCPKNELLLIDSVHSLFKDLGFKISTGINYHSVDRIVRIPDTQEVFGVEILMSEGEAENNHPKLRRALEFEKEKKENEKILIVASTHIRLPLSERSQTKDISEEMVDFLARHKMSFITAYELCELWQKAKGGENGVFGVFQKLYSHPGGIFHLKEIKNSDPASFDRNVPQSPAS
jgi:hypothetical protein